MTSVIPNISVVLPALDRPALLRRSIASVLQQTWRDLELIVVDDGSTEDLQPVVRSFEDARLRYVRRERTGGAAAARNTGVQEARGHYLAFQDSGDEWLLDKLAKQLAALQSSAPDGGMAICGLLRISGREVRHYPGAGYGGRACATHDDVLAYPFAYTQSWLVPRSVVISAGGFDESLRVWEDWELLIRLSARVEVLVIQEPLVISPTTVDGLSAGHDRFIEAMKHILEKHSADLGGRPRVLGQLKYAQGRLYGAAGCPEETRAALGQALRLRPMHWRAAAVFALSFAGATRLPRLLRRIGGT